MRTQHYKCWMFEVYDWPGGYSATAKKANLTIIANNYVGPETAENSIKILIDAIEECVEVE